MEDEAGKVGQGQFKKNLLCVLRNVDFKREREKQKSMKLVNRKAGEF